MDAVLSLRDLVIRFSTPDGAFDAVRGVNIDVRAGETVAVVGESGSGKSQTFLAVLGLLARNGTASGTAAFDGLDLLALGRSDLDAVRGRDIAMIFQDPMTALNPSLTVARQLTEVLEKHFRLDRSEARAQAIAMLERVGFPDAAERIGAYPHALSGGMRQRVMIAMALLCRPKVLIADEPTTALDVTLQAQILRLFQKLQQETGTAIVLITHDLGVVAALADRVNVMYAGRVVEAGPVADIFARPLHKYTRALLDSTPRPDGASGALTPIAGYPPNLQRLPPGCAFHPRCPAAIDTCREEIPAFLGDGERGSACILDGHPDRRPTARAGEAGEGSSA